MTEFIFRTEDMRPEEVNHYFVESGQDCVIIDALKSRKPTVLVGSRGVGKSFLLRMAQKEILDNLHPLKEFPVYLSFVRSSLIQSNDPEKFKHWMLARICSQVVRSLMKAGLISSIPRSARVLAGTDCITDAQPTKVEAIAEAYESSWRRPSAFIDRSELPTVDDLKDAIEDRAVELARISHQEWVHRPRESEKVVLRERLDQIA